MGMLVLLLAGCPATDDQAVQPAELQGTSTPASATPSSTEPTTRPAAPRQPLALAVNIRRTPLDIAVPVARRISDDANTSWAALGQTGGRIDIRIGPGALDAVERNADVLAVVPAFRLRPTVQAVSVAGIDPMRDPADYALTVRAPRVPPSVTTLTVVGDIMLGRGVAEVAAAAGDPSAPLRPLQRRLAAADLTVGNLESTLSQAGPPEQGGDSFAAPPAVLDGLTDAGFDLLSLANNHAGDYGDEALLRTLARVRQSPIRSVGAGRDARQAWRPVVLRHGSTTFGFVAFNAIGETPSATRTQPGAAEVRMQPRTGPLDADDLRRLTATITALSQRVDVVVAMPHWGDQYTYTPVPDQRRVGAAMVDAGADIVVGGHPHWTQGVQRHHGRLVVHSLGNFVFDMDFSRQTQEGVMLELVFWGDELMATDFTPYVIGAGYAPRLAGNARAAAILAPMWAASDPPFSS